MLLQPLITLIIHRITIIMLGIQIQRESFLPPLLLSLDPMSQVMTPCHRDLHHLLLHHRLRLLPPFIITTATVIIGWVTKTAKTRLRWNLLPEEQEDPLLLQLLPVRDHLLLIKQRPVNRRLVYEISFCTLHASCCCVLRGRNVVTKLTANQSDVLYEKQ